jgi:hypothetical protein
MTSPYNLGCGSYDLQRYDKKRTNLSLHKYWIISRRQYIEKLPIPFRFLHKSSFDLLHVVQSRLDVFNEGYRGSTDDGGVCDIAARSGDTDTMSIADFGILHDRDLVSIRQEGIELANEEGVTVEEVGYPLNDTGCVDPNPLSARRELEGNDTHS